MTSSLSEPQTKKSLPYGLQPHEVGFLVLLGAAFYSTQEAYHEQPWPVWVFGAALLAAVPVLIWRSRAEWAQMPNKGFFLSLAGLWILMFSFFGNAKFNYGDSHSNLVWLFSQYTSPSLDEGHGLLIPFVVVALYWWRRKELLARPPGLWWPAIIIIAFALFLQFVGFVSQQQRLSALAFFLGLYALTGLAWGWTWLKASCFPFFLLIFCVPVSEYSGTLTLPLRLLVSRIVEFIAHLGLAPDLIREGTMLYDAQHTFGYEVAAACSGIRSLVALLALMTIYGFLNFQAPWKRAVMMLIALPLAVLGNVVRLCFTVAVSEILGQTAGKAVETKFGFLTFAVAVGCAFLVARWLENVGTDKTNEKDELPPGSLTSKPATP